MSAKACSTEALAQVAERRRVGGLRCRPQLDGASVPPRFRRGVESQARVGCDSFAASPLCVLVDASAASLRVAEADLERLTTGRVLSRVDARHLLAVAC
jgi:hypothetical protein